MGVALLRRWLQFRVEVCGGFRWYWFVGVEGRWVGCDLRRVCWFRSVVLLLFVWWDAFFVVKNSCCQIW